MAIDVDQTDVLIDHWVEWTISSWAFFMASPDSFEKDPLRVLRAVHVLQAYSMGLALETSAVAWPKIN